jgi:predicted anti-sigma-YlaC factor YlaD
MTGDLKSMSCQEFQDQLSELIGSGADASAHPHLQNCELCRALLNDLETIAEAARQLFPIQQPEDDLWERIESAIKQDEDEVPPDGVSAEGGVSKAD